MLYHLFDWMTKNGIKFPGSGLFQFTSFRILLAVILSLVIATVFGKRLINYLTKKQIGESVRELGLDGEKEKKETPTMGGIIILLSILIPTLLLANLDKVYIRLMLLSTVWLGVIGFIDDYFKMRAKRIAKEKGIYEVDLSLDKAGVCDMTIVINNINNSNSNSNKKTIQLRFLGKAQFDQGFARHYLRC